LQQPRYISTRADDVENLDGWLIAAVDDRVAPHDGPEPDRPVGEIVASVAHARAPSQLLGGSRERKPNAMSARRASIADIVDDRIEFSSTCGENS